jgi:DNA-binding response OmpR family regulator
MPNPDWILIVEHHRDTLAAWFFELTQAGFSVLTAQDGAQAIDLIDHGVRPRLVVLDLVLPKVDGWTIIKHLQGDIDLRQIPVIVTTALSQANQRVQGADVILEKPIDPSRLILEIGRLTGRAVAPQ